MRNGYYVYTPDLTQTKLWLGIDKSAIIEVGDGDYCYAIGSDVAVINQKSEGVYRGH